MKLRHLDLFSGLGGFALGLQRTEGFETIGFCEIDPYCQKVLKKNFPGIPIFEDVRNFDANGLGRIDIITGGYPCQPFSTAGKRQGDQDDRHLWPAMFAVIKTIRPTWVIGENVAGHVSMGLDEVLSDLENEGYTCRPYIIPACAVDAPHRRDRVWTVAHTNSIRGNRRTTKQKPDWGQVAKGNCVCIGRKWLVESGVGGMVDGLSSGMDGYRIAQWIPEPEGIPRVASGVKNRNSRLKGLGNAVLRQIPELFGHAILSSIQQTQRN